MEGRVCSLVCGWYILKPHAASCAALQQLLRQCPKQGQKMLPGSKSCSHRLEMTAGAKKCQFKQQASLLAQWGLVVSRGPDEIASCPNHNLNHIFKFIFACHWRWWRQGTAAEATPARQSNQPVNQRLLTMNTDGSDSGIHIHCSACRGKSRTETESAQCQ